MFETQVQKKEESKNGEELVQLLVFKLENEEYTVEIGQVQEIVSNFEITYIPNSPKFLSGIINLRGQVTPIIDLKQKFDLKESENKGNYIVIAQLKKGDVFGFKVDEVIEIFKTTKKNIKEPSRFVLKKIGSDYVKGVVIIDKRLLILINLFSILSEEEITKLSQSVNKK